MVNKTAIVTGANGAIGSAIVKMLLHEGVKCIQVDVTNPGKKDFVVCDFTDGKQIENLIKKIQSAHDKIDYLFNVAGVGIYKNLEELNPQDWHNSVAINLTSPLLITKGLLPLLKKSKSGTIFNIGSGMGIIPTEGRVAYCSTKFGLRGLSLTLSEELKKIGLSVVHLTLGSVMTNFGTGGLKKRKELQKQGKKYLTVEQVVKKIQEIIASPHKDPEYVMYPEGYN